MMKLELELKCSGFFKIMQCDKFKVGGISKH